MKLGNWQHLIQKCTQLDHRVGLVESLTGGLVGYLLIQHSGASQVVAGSLVAYTLETKTRLLEVPQGILKDGVNPEVALWMAQKARILFESTWGLGITGFAGPMGGNQKEPVGSIYLAISGPMNLVQRKVFDGERQEIQFQAAQEILKLWEFCLDRISILGLSFHKETSRT